MLDLFDASALPGLRMRLDLIDTTKERALIDNNEATDLKPFRFQGWTGKRVTTSFGFSYDFEIGRQLRAPPVPDCLVQALLIRYDPGAGIGWHRDRPIYEHVVGLSLGTPATMRFRQRRDDGFARASVPLEPRGAYHLSGPSRYEWEHRIVEGMEPRWSMTFRSLAHRQ